MPGKNEIEVWEEKSVRQVVRGNDQYRIEIFQPCVYGATAGPIFSKAEVWWNVGDSWTRIGTVEPTTDSEQKVVTRGLDVIRAHIPKDRS